MKENINRKWATITKMNKEIEEIYHKIAKHYNMSDTCFWVLYILYERNEPCTQKEMCAYWSYTKQTINSAIKTLEQIGYIQKGYEENGKTNKKIYLTKRGKEVAKNTVKEIIEIEDRVYKSIDEKELDMVINLLQRPLELLREETKKII